MAEAASFSWSAAAGKTYAGYDVYIAKSASYANLAALEADLLGTSGNSGTLVAGSRSSSATGTLTGLTAKTSASDPNINYDFYYVFVKDNDYWVSAKQTVSIGLETDTAPSVTFAQASGTDLLSGAKSGSFGGAPVPEPTSGLLILLGVAGLALRRRRA